MYISRFIEKANVVIKKRETDIKRNNNITQELYTYIYS